MSDKSNQHSAITSFLSELAGMFQFIGRFFKEVLFPPYELGEVVTQFYTIGYKSFPLVGITGFIMGLVLTLQSKPTLMQFGAESWLPAMVSVSIVREIGPIITALICAGKVGSSIGAELGSMKVTEQIDAMKVSGTNPFKYVVVTRVLATTIMIPVLVIWADAISLMGSFAAININGDISFILYFSQAFDKVDFIDIIPSIGKSFFFGFAIGIIGCYKGWNSKNGTAGVGIAANSAVVLSSLMVFIIDMIAAQITSMFM